jgi:hypothetical protein
VEEAAVEEPVPHLEQEQAVAVVVVLVRHA